MFVPVCELHSVSAALKQDNPRLLIQIRALRAADNVTVRQTDGYVDAAKSLQYTGKKNPKKVRDKVLTAKESFGHSLAPQVTHFIGASRNHIDGSVET